MSRTRQRHLLPLLLLVLAAGARATPMSIAEAEGYNLLVWGNATLLNSDTEGRVAVGGNATFNGYSVGTHAVNPTPQTASLIVGGNLAAGHGQVYNGSVYVGGTYSGPGYSLSSRPDSVTASGLGSAVPFDFDAAEAALKARSLAFASETANGSSILQWSTLTLTGTDSTLNVFNLTAAMLANASTLSLNVAAGSRVLINVSGSSVTFGNKGITGNASAQQTLFNFHQATSLTLMNIGVEGSILAPNADVSFWSGQMNGQLIANSFSGQSWGVGELHHHPFNNEPTPPSSVPDGGLTALLLAPIAGLLIWHRAGRRPAAGVRPS